MRTLHTYHPRSLAEAVEILVECLEPDERDALRKCGKEEAILTTHFSMGRTIRRAWLTGARGTALLREANPGFEGRHPSKLGADQVSAAITQRVWQILREQS